jgi:hypothetical protein
MQICWTTGVRFQAGTSLRQRVKTDSEAQWGLFWVQSSRSVKLANFGLIPTIKASPYQATLPCCLKPSYGRYWHKLQILSVQNCFNPLTAKLNPICHLLALLGAHHILHVSRIRVKGTQKISQIVTSLKSHNTYWNKRDNLHVNVGVRGVCVTTVAVEKYEAVPILHACL